MEIRIGKAAPSYAMADASALTPVLPNFPICPVLHKLKWRFLRYHFEDQTGDQIGIQGIFRHELLNTA
jgi:hypothetical protein